MRDVGAADVEGPSDGVRVRHDERVGAQLRQFGANAGKLFAHVFAGEAHIVQGDRSERRRRAVRPDDVDQVRLDRDQLRAGGRAGFLQPLRGLYRVQPGIVAEPVVCREILLDPAMRRRLDQVLDRKQRGVRLLVRLQRVAPIDEEYCALHQHDADACRAGEAGEPGEALLARRHVFVLVAVGARHDEAGQAPPRELRAQRRHARCAGAALGSLFE